MFDDKPSAKDIGKYSEHKPALLIPEIFRNLFFNQSIMKKLFTILCTAIMLTTVSCERYEEIWETLRDHEQRIEQLEKLCRELNSNMQAVQTILTAVQQNDYVTEVMKIVDDGIEVGYSITFAKGGTVNIYHGADGSDGSTPNIGIRKASDGASYWTSDGEWMTGEDGEMIPATVTDPDGGYIVPQFRIADGIWYASYDNGNSWRQIEGFDGENNSSIITDIDTSDSNYVVITLEDGSTIKLPKFKEPEMTEVKLVKEVANATMDGYVLPSQTIGSEVRFGEFATSYMFEIPIGAVVYLEPVSGGNYGFALCDINDRVLEYTNNEGNYIFEARGIKTHLWVSVPKLGSSVYRMPATEDIHSCTNYWTGKTIWWCGTSIPAGGYPELVGQMLGADVINTAVGGSMCRANVRTGDYNGANISNITSSLTMTSDEVESFILNYNGLKSLSGNTSWPAELSDLQLQRMRSGSFEEKLLPYLDGTKPMPDLWIIDHGHNDWKYKDSQGKIDISLQPTRENIDAGELAEDTYMTETIDGVKYARLQKYLGSFENINPAQLDDFVCSLNRNCYYGALNFITTLILVHNPQARFMMIGNYSNEHSGETGYADLVPAQKAWAADWCFPFCDIASCFGTSQHIIPGTKDWMNEEFSYDTDVFHIYCPDGVHPSSDDTQNALHIYAGIIAEFIKSHR